MPSALTKYVNTNSSGGDGSTNGTSGASAAYASLSAFEAANRQNLVTGDKLLTVYCDGTAADTTAVTFASSNWTTDATRKIQIRPHPNSVHNGVYSTARYRFEPSGSNGLLIDGVYLDVIGLQAGSTSSGTAVFYFYNADSTTRRNEVSQCVIGSAAGAARHGLKVLVDSGGSNKTFVFANNIIYGLKGAIIDIADGCTAVVYNNTILDGAVGIELSDSNRVSTNPNFYVKGNVVKGSSIADYGNFTSASTVTTATNFTGDTSSPDSLGSKTFTFQDAANKDYHLSPSDASGARGGGSDLSADGQYAFSTDVEGDLRKAGAFDAGADQIIPAVDRWFARPADRPREKLEVTDY